MEHSQYQTLATLQIVPAWVKATTYNLSQQEHLLHTFCSNENVYKT